MATPVALVTGATRGIGRATALLLGKAGYSMGVTARSAADVEALAAELEGRGVSAAGMAADVGDPDAVEALHRHVAERLGPVDLLVNNAGVLIGKPLVEMTVAEWDTTFATNVRSLYLLTRLVLPDMRARGRGDIVNIASLAGKHGTANLVAYCASKHAVVGFSRALMQEVRKEGIRVIAICPGSVDTSMMRGQETLRPDCDRVLAPEDVANAVLDAVKLPRRGMVSEIDLRPSNP